MATEQTFRQPLGSETRFIEGSTGRLLGTETQLKEQANMARLEGTGKDPLGRYGKGEIFDVPKNISAGDDTVENPTYAELIEKGYAKEVAPEDDPGRTLTQIADAKVVDPNSTLAHPVDAALADGISEADAYAIVHTGDPKAKADGDLKTKEIRESQHDDRRQYGRSAVLSEEAPDEQSGVEATEEEKPAKSAASGSSSTAAKGGTSS
jgi:hypothetical protein